MDWWKNILNLFQSSKESSASNPVIHTVIERNPEFDAKYTLWKNGLVKRRLLSWLADQYAIFQANPDDIDETITFLATTSSKGFAIHFNKMNYSVQEGRYFLDYLKEKTLELPYITQLSDTRTFNRPNWVETIERHYLKPRANADDETKQAQRFGNIRIEISFRNEKLHDLKFSATTYQDYLFKDAEDFQLLINHLFL